MRIIQMTNTYTPIVGGVERSIRTFSEELKKKGHEVIIIAPTFDGMPIHEEGVIRIPSIQKFNHTDFSLSLPIPGVLTKLMHEFKPDVVHSHHPFLMGDMAMRLCGQYERPLIFTYHTMFEEYLHYLPFHNDMMKRFIIELSVGYANLVDEVVVPSQSVKNILVERGVETKMTVIPTGVDVNRFSHGDGSKVRKQFKISDEAFVIGHIGRLTPEKNLVFLAKAVSEFLSKAKSAHFIVGGSGSEERLMQEVFAKENVLARTHFMGTVKGQSLINTYYSMDIFAFSSITETQGLVLTEAMACGIPVVAIDAPGSRDIVEDGKNGRLVHNHTTENFKEALCWSANQKFSDFQVMKKESLKTAQSFSSESSSKALRQLYDRVEYKAKQKYQHKHYVWSSVMGRIKTEWEMAKNIAEAGSAALYEGKHKSSKKVFMHNEVENWLLKLRRKFNRSEWARYFLGLSKSKGTQAHPGLILIQVDGFSKKQLEQAVKKGEMPFVKRLLNKEHYSLYPYYSGQPSSTPSVQGELFYGIKQSVPAFAFFDQISRKILRMYDGDAAVIVEKKLEKDMNSEDCLLKGGSSYSNVFSGGSKETHFCSVSLGWSRIWKRLDILNMIWLILTHVFVILWMIFLVVLEFGLAIVDCMIGLAKGYHWRKELKFVITRPVICILLRNLITLGATVDIARGLPIIHMNFLGFDEQAHRRGPSSRFAHKVLPGIDRAIAKVYRHALHSSRRNYDVWIYSDHGQEDVISYWKKYGKPVREAVAEVFDEFETAEGHHTDYAGVTFQRVRYLGVGGWLQRLLFSGEGQGNFDGKKLVVTAIGPTANVYLPEELTDEEKDMFARKLVKEAHIPIVFVCYGSNGLKAWNAQGVFTFPQEAEAVLGKHPYLKEIAEDLISVCHHRDAGTFMLSGWCLGEKSYSFPIENGAHAGPGVEETNAFALVPSDISLQKEGKNHVCTQDIRKAALQFLGRIHQDNNIVGADPCVCPSIRADTGVRPYSNHKTIRIMTYNVHSCLGMDGKISPERIARVIARHQPDIVALQEIDIHRERTGGLDQAYIIAQHLEMMYHFHPAIHLEEEQYGDVILSRYPMKLIKADALPGRFKPQWETRGAVWVEVEINENLKVQVINAHLGLHRKERMVQTEELLGKKWMGSLNAQHRVVFCGDFNAFPQSKVCQVIKDKSFRDVQEDLESHRPHATWPSHIPLTRIDHIFVGHGIEVENVILSKTKLDKTASDHLPLMVDVSL